VDQGAHLHSPPGPTGVFRGGEDMDPMKALFEPGCVAVIGASASFGKWGYVIPHNILRGGYRGELVLVNPRGGTLHGLPLYRSLEEAGSRVDMAMISLPAAQVEGVLEDCARAGVRVVIPIAGGFSEASREGALMEAKMVEKARSLGMRVVGPNTMGIYSGPASLCALMPPVRPRPGRIAFAAQSGNLGTQMLGWGAYRGVGFSRFVCVGNQADLDFLDYLEYFGVDPATEVVLLYVEGFRRPKETAEVIRRISRRKPVVVYKAGGTRAGSRAAASHSAALAGSDEVFRGVARQSGMILAETTEEMLDFSDALAKLPLPRGGRVAILTWGGGWGVVTADLCERSGLEVVPLPQEVRTELDNILPPYWSRGNPVDMVGLFDLAAHARCLEIVASSPAYDMVIALGSVNAAGAFSLRDEGPGVEERRKRVREMTLAFRRRVAGLVEITGKPIITVGMPQREDELFEGGSCGGDRLCVYTSPERAVKVAAMLARRAEDLAGRRGPGGEGP